MDPGRALIRNLESTFDAAVAREEEEAASDLAFSLSQDVGFIHSLQKSGCALLSREGGGGAEIAEIGRDFVSACGYDSVSLVPLARVVAERSAGPPPAISPDSFVARLRSLARRGVRAEVVTPSGRFQGRLLRAGPDHVAVAARGGEVVIGLDAVSRVNLDRGGSEDAL